MGIFRHHGCVGTGMLRHRAKQYRHFGMSARECQNLPVLKYACAKMFHAELFMVPKNTHAEMFLSQDVLVTKSPHDEISVPKCLFPKCQGPKQAQALKIVSLCSDIQMFRQDQPSILRRHVQSPLWWSLANWVYYVLITKKSTICNRNSTEKMLVLVKGK